MQVVILPSRHGVFSTSDASQTILNTIPHTIIGYGLNPWWAGAGNIGFLYGNGGSFGWSNPNYYFTNPIPFFENWVNHSIVKSGNTWSFYQNSILVHDYNATSQPASIISQLVFGHCDPSICSETFVGSLDDIGIWNRALTPEEIAGLYYSAECTHGLSLTPENTISNLGSTVSFSAITSDTNPVYTWQTDLGQGFQNVVDYGSYSGASTSTLTISDLQLNNHIQPIRVISTSGICMDTSAVALISIADTCITNVIDTTYIIVTDTLIINLGPTGFNPVTYSNTILMYPNPSNDQLTIDFGDYATLAGYTLKIFNSIGQEIHSANINQQQEVLPLGTWGGAGNYQVVIYNAQGVPVDTRTIVLQ
jgi:hypothetical protein